MEEKAENLKTPVASPVDPKEYRAIRLKNGLKALIIKDSVEEGIFFVFKYISII